MIVCDYKVEVETCWEEEKFFFRRGMSELRGRLTFPEEVNTKLKQTLETGNRCKVKYKKKIHTKVS